MLFDSFTDELAMLSYSEIYIFELVYDAKKGTKNIRSLFYNEMVQEILHWL